MGSQAIDLVYEMQGELNWDKEFASLACKEYSRWLQLRAKTGDFQFCKLPPSRVVAMVWNMHRQWTLDYEQTCTALGGFIHHFPPAMRLSFSREQGYAVTLQTYKSHFREDPPASYWEPPICPSRPDVGTPGLLMQNTEQARDMETRLAGSAVQQCNPTLDNGVSGTPTTNTGVQKSSRFPRLKRKSASTLRQTASILAGEQVAQEEGNSDIPMEPIVLGESTEPLSMAQGAVIPNDANATQRYEERSIERRQGDTVEKEGNVIKTPRGGRRVQEGFVLRPLAPGEKRRRGRPSMSDYVPVSQLANAHGNGEKSTLLVKENSKDVGSSPAESKRESVTTGKRRKGRSTKSHLQVQKLRPSQKAGDSNVEYSGSANQAFPASEGKRNAATVTRSNATGRKKAEASHKQQVRIGPDGSILRRPPGRPRKDGSWPVPRAKGQQVSPPTQKRKLNSGLLSTSQTTEDASAKREGFLPTAMVTDVDIEHGHVPIPDSEGGSTQQIVDAVDTVSNEVQLQIASEMEQETVL